MRQMYAELWNYCATQYTMETRRALKSLRLSKFRRPSYASIRKSGARTMRPLKYRRPNYASETVWARENLQLLTSSKSCWRALVQMMLPLVHLVLKWLEHLGRPAYMGGVSPGCCTGTTCRNIGALSKYTRAPTFSPFPGEKSKIYLGFPVSYHCT